MHSIRSVAVMFVGAGLLLAPAGGLRAQELLEGEVVLKVPVNGKLKGIDVYLDAEGGHAREEQVAKEPDSLLSIGRVRSSVVDLQGKDKVRREQRVVDQPVLFYLYAPTSHVESFEIEPVSARTGEGFLTSGSTPDRFIVEAMELRGIGEAKGTVLKRFDNVGFRVGEPNRFPLGVDVAADSKLGVRVWADPSGSDELSIQVKASRKGKYPARVLSRGEEDVEAGMGHYNPGVAFTYRGAPSSGGLDVGNPLERLAEQINNYLDGQEGKTSGEVRIPLKVRLQVER